MKKIILMFLLALVMLQSTVLLASAAPVLPDLERDGSITFQMVKNGTKLDGGICAWPELVTFRKMTATISLFSLIA